MHDKEALGLPKRRRERHLSRLHGAIFDFEQTGPSSSQLFALEQSGSLPDPYAVDQMAMAQPRHRLQLCRERNMKGDLGSGVGQLLRSASEAFRDSKRRRKLQQEIQMLGDAEGDRVLHDCGLSRNEFTAFLQNALPMADLVSPAMRSIGLDPAALSTRRPDWSQDIGRSCMSCQYRRRCRDDVSAQRFAAHYRSYCVNSDSFDEMVKAGRLS